jgi:cell division protein FtsL
MAKRRVAARRRSAIAVVLVGFVLVATGVIARRALGVRQQTEIRKLRQRLDSLRSERTRLEGQIRDWSSRARLQPIAEQRLNMHIPTPEQQIILQRGDSASPRAPRTPPIRHDSL